MTLKWHKRVMAACGGVGIGKLLTAGVVATVALVLTILPLGTRLGLWSGLAGHAGIALLVAIGVGAAAGLAFWLTLGRIIESDVRKIVKHLDSHSKGQHDAVACPSPLYLSSLTHAIQQATSALRHRMDQQSNQKRELEIQLRVSEAERLHAESILQSLSDAVLVTDSFNEVAMANESAAEALRFRLEDANRQPVDKLVTDTALVKLIKDTRESANLANRRHVEHTIHDGARPRTYDVTLACVGGAQQEVNGVVTILHDITKEKEISEMKSDFVSAVSHELRTPLSSIKAYVEMLLDNEAPDETTRQEFYGIIQSETNRLSRLIDNILNISRIESGVVKVQREHISLPTLIKEVMDVMQPQARAKNIELSEQSSPLYYQVYADKDMIYQALLNLVGNAIKYTPDGGKVTVDTFVDDHQRTVTVNVTDTGVGIPPDAMQHLFQKFYRVSDHKKMAKGTGLGLNLVKHIIETVHGGAVSVESEVGCGSTFSFALPIADGSS